MGKLPAFFVTILALWLAWNVYAEGSESALGGLFGLFHEPQYGEADHPTRSGRFADTVLDEGASD